MQICILKIMELISAYIEQQYFLLGGFGSSDIARDLHLLGNI